MAGHNHPVLSICLCALLAGCSGIYFEQPLSSFSSTSFTTAAAVPSDPAIEASSANQATSNESNTAASNESYPAAPGARVYLLRGLIGDIFSLGMDKLGTTLNRSSVSAQTYRVFAWPWVAETAASAYRRNAAPIVLAGHSTGGDNIIKIAWRLNTARIPVALLVTFDPTPVADPLPPNVERALNIYQSTNPIGGGQIKPGPGFRGHLANVNLREHREIIHITMDKSDTLHALVAGKILEVVETAKARRTPIESPAQFLHAASLKQIPSPPSPAAVPIKYTIPAAAPIVMWDSGTTVTVAPEDSLETIGQKFGVPIWAIAQINNLNAADGIRQGQRLVVPRNAFAFAATPEPLPENNSTISARRNAPAPKHNPRDRSARQLSPTVAKDN